MTNRSDSTIRWALPRILLPILILGCAASGSGLLERVQKSAADRLASEVPSPSWQASLPDFSGTALDEIAVIDANSVLVGVSDGPYLRIDAHNGEVLWSYPRSKGTRQHIVIAVQPAIVVAETGDKTLDFEALDVLAGKRLWRVSTPRGSRMGMTPNFEGLVIASANPSGSRVRYLDVQTGEEGWDVDLPGEKSGVPELLFTPTRVIAVGRSAWALARGDGRQIWHAAAIGPIAESSFAIQQGNILVIPSSAGIISRLDEEGTVLWRKQLTGPPGPMLLEQDFLFAITLAEDGHATRVTCLDPNTGRVLWDRAIERRVMSNLLLARGQLLFTGFDERAGRNWLEARDPASGAVVRRIALEDIGAQRLPDRLMMVNDRLILAQEDRVSAFELDDGSNVWLLRTGSLIRYAAAREDLASLLESLQTALFNLARVDGTDPEDVRVPPLGERQDQVLLAQIGRLQQLSVNIASADSNSSSPVRPTGSSKAENETSKRAVREATREISESIVGLREKSASEVQLSTGLERDGPLLTEGYEGTTRIDRDAIMRRELARESMRQEQESRLAALASEISTLKVRIAMDAARADMEFQFATWEAIFGILRVRYAEHVRDLQEAVSNQAAKVANLHAMYLRRVQGHYYVQQIRHPIWNEGADDPVERESWWGFILVDMQTGQWARVVLGVPKGLSALDVELDASNQLPTVSIDDSKVLAWGVGLDTSRWRIAKGGATAAIQASLVAFDLADLDFREPEEYVQSRRWGYIDRSGNLAIPEMFQQAGAFAENRAVVGYEGRVGFIDENGQIVVPIRYREALPFSEGVAVIRDEDLSFFVDRDGRKVAGGKSFEKADIFSGGLAPVQVGERSGFIDQDGDFAIEPRYDVVYPFSEGLAVARLAEGRSPTYGLIDQSGKFVVAPTLFHAATKEGRWPFREGRAAFRTEPFGKMGFVDRNGDVVIPASYDGVEPFSEGLARVQVGSRSHAQYGFVDRAGRVVVPVEYKKAAESFVEGLAAVSRDGSKWGFIDRGGRVVLDFEFDAAASFAEGLAPVALGQEELRKRFGLRSRLGGKVFGYIDRRGRFVIPPRFRGAAPFSEGLAAAQGLEQPLVKAIAEPVTLPSARQQAEAQP